MNSNISFILDQQIETIHFGADSKLSPTTTVLNYLRGLPDHKGVKEGCAEGDCGACTVVIADLDEKNQIQYRAVNSCLIFLPKLHGKWLITIEDIKNPDGTLHPVQQAMVDYHGSQCGFCTPGFIMSMFALYKSKLSTSRSVIEDALTGNLCRCTGYQSIIEAAEYAREKKESDHFSQTETEIIKKMQSINQKSIQICTDHQKYFLPVTMKELHEIKKQNPDSILINGATDIALRVTKNHELLPSMIDTIQIEELKIIKESDDHLYCGSAVTLNQLMNVSEECYPAIHEVCSVFGSRQIRELATIGGNIASASPIGDLTPVLFAYRAEVLIVLEQGEHMIPIDQFISGYRKTVLKKNEIVKGIKIPKPANNAVIKVYKVSKRKDLDISTISAAFYFLVDKNNIINKIKIIFGGMAEMTKYAVQTEKFLIGKNWSRETVEEAMPVLKSEFTPISDARSGAQFRSIAARNILLKFWKDSSLDT